MRVGKSLSPRPISPHKRANAISGPTTTRRITTSTTFPLEMCRTKVRIVHVLSTANPLAQASELAVEAGHLITRW
jgi:hypothetical protein